MTKPEEELAAIKSMMEQSTRFLSLRGLAGILAGIYSLFAAAIAYYWIYYPRYPVGNELLVVYQNGTLTYLVLLGLGLILVTLCSTWILSRQKSKRMAHPLWMPASKRFVQALAIPVLAGGMFCIALIHQGQMILTFPVMLLFYGTGLLNAVNFSLSKLKYLGFGNLILGVTAGFLPAGGFILWVFGFGVLHLVFGGMIYFRDDH